VTEIGSALNGKRRKFLALVGDETVTTIVVEHRDRFARFGAGYVDAETVRARTSPAGSRHCPRLMMCGT